MSGLRYPGVSENNKPGVEEINKEVQIPNDQPQELKHKGVEKTLSTIANIILFLGILSSLIMMFTITTTKIGYDTSVANPDGIITTLAAGLATIVIWGVLRVLCNISTSLKEINRKTHKQ